MIPQKSPFPAKKLSTQADSRIQRKLTYRYIQKNAARLVGSYFLKPVVSLALIAGVVYTGGVQTISHIDTAPSVAPGTMFYSVKRTREVNHLNTLNTQLARSDFYLTLAQKRLNESHTLFSNIAPQFSWHGATAHASSTVSSPIVVALLGESTEFAYLSFQGAQKIEDQSKAKHLYVKNQVITQQQQQQMQNIQLQWEQEENKNFQIMQRNVQAQLYALGQLTENETTQFAYQAQQTEEKPMMVAVAPSSAKRTMLPEVESINPKAIPSMARNASGSSIDSTYQNQETADAFPAPMALMAFDVQEDSATQNQEAPMAAMSAVASMDNMEIDYQAEESFDAEQFQDVAEPEESRRAVSFMAMPMAGEAPKQEMETMQAIEMAQEGESLMQPESFSIQDISVQTTPTFQFQDWSQSWVTSDEISILESEFWENTVQQ